MFPGKDTTQPSEPPAPPVLCPSQSKDIYSHFQSELLVFQFVQSYCWAPLKSVLSHPLDILPSNNKTYWSDHLEPCFLKAEQAELPQPFFIWVILQTLNYFSNFLLDLLLYVHISLLLWILELGTELHTCPHWHWVGRSPPLTCWQHPLCSAGYNSSWPRGHTAGLRSACCLQESLKSFSTNLFSGRMVPSLYQWMGLSSPYTGLL